MALSENERASLLAAGTSPDPNERHRAVAIVLNKSGADRDEARDLLGRGFVQATQPSFHLVPRGDVMASESEFAAAHERLATETDQFDDVTAETLTSVLLDCPEALAPLRMILGLTHNELAVAMKLVDPTSRKSGNSLKSFERSGPKPVTAARTEFAGLIARTAVAAMNREILSVPGAAADTFHSKLDKRDTRDGWESVAHDARGIPYSALLYQRYVGGVWRQVQDAYSEVKGDNLLEIPIETLLTEAGIPHHRSAGGPAGAAETAERFGLSPGPDFVLAPDSPTAVIESKVAEDGGTARDKSARIRTLVEAANTRGLLACAVVDGKGWSERPSVLVDVVIATGGRTYSLETLDHLLEVPQIASLRTNR